MPFKEMKKLYWVAHSAFPDLSRWVALACSCCTGETKEGFVRELLQIYRPAFLQSGFELTAIAQMQLS